MGNRPCQRYMSEGCSEDVPSCFAEDGDLSVTPSPTEAAKRRALRMWALAWFGVENCRWMMVGWM